jgi:tryptophanyl-tRNA synthetase
MFTVEEREGYVSVRSKNAPQEAVSAVHAAFPGSKKFEGHVDIRGLPLREVEERVRAIEREHGGYGFFIPSSTYHIFMPGLQGGKMSSSVPESLFTFSEPDESIGKKVRGALTGGRMTVEEQKRLGGEPDRCSVYLLNLFHLVGDDRELEEIRKACLEGRLMCGPCKKATLERVNAFLADFRARMGATTGGG